MDKLEKILEKLSDLENQISSMNKLELVLEKIYDMENQLLAINEIITDKFGKTILLPYDSYLDSVAGECQEYISSILFDLFDSIKNKDDLELIKYNKDDFLESKINLYRTIIRYNMIKKSSNELYEILSNKLKDYYELENNFKLYPDLDGYPNMAIIEKPLFPIECPWTIDDLATNSFETLLRKIKK